MSTKNDLDTIWNGVEEVSRGRAEHRIDDRSMDAYLQALTGAADDLPDTCRPVRDALAALRDDHGARILTEEQLAYRFRALFDTLASVRGSVHDDTEGEIRSRSATVNITESAEDYVCQVNGNGSSTEQVLEDMMMAMTVLVGRAARQIAASAPEAVRDGAEEITRLTLVANVAKRLMGNVMDGADRYGQNEG